MVVKVTKKTIKRTAKPKVKKPSAYTGQYILAWHLLNEEADIFKIHTKDGKTARVDLSNEGQSELWLGRLKDPEFQKTITAISVVQECAGRFKCPDCKRVSKLKCSRCGRPATEVFCGTGTQHTITKPVGFDKMSFEVERLVPNENGKAKGGERVTCFVGDVRLTMTFHSSQSSRMSLLKTGKRRFNPSERKNG